MERNKEHTKSSDKRRLTKVEKRRIKRRKKIIYYTRLTCYICVFLLVIIILSKGCMRIIRFFDSAVEAVETKVETQEDEQVEVGEEKNATDKELLLDSTRQEILLEKIMDKQEQYPENLITLAKNKPETRQFVYDYLAKGIETLAASTIEINLKEEELNNSFPVLQQWDERWGYKTYGDDFLALTGCGPTCLAIVYLGLTGDTSQNPYTIASLSEENGYFVSGSGTSWELMDRGMESLGLESTTLSLDEGKIQKSLNEGHPVILSMRPGIFTSSGHFIVVVGYEDGEYLINDPDNIENSRKTWKYDQIKDQIKNIWSFKES